MSGQRQTCQTTVAHSTASHSINTFLTYLFVLFGTTFASSEPTDVIETRHLAVEVGTNVIFNCTAMRAIWIKWDSARASPDYLYIGTQPYNTEIPEKFRYKIDMIVFDRPLKNPL